jgi:hypothetical protein
VIQINAVKEGEGLRVLSFRYDEATPFSGVSTDVCFGPAKRLVQA